jgi:hypothetical protein
MLLWRNVRRLAAALGIIHTQSLVRGNLTDDAVMAEGSDDPDFQLGGFEWSLWVGADRAERTHANLGPQAPPGGRKHIRSRRIGAPSEISSLIASMSR